MTISQILMTNYQRLFPDHYQISTKDYVRIYKQIMQNKPNFPHFSTKNDDFTKNKPNSNPIQTQTNPILGQYQGWQSQNKPNSNPICKRLKMLEFTLDVCSLALEFTLGVCLLACLPGVGGVDKELYDCFL